MNLSTAIAGKRAKEIGMKKVLGAYRKQLIIQFITESIILSIIGLAIALAIVEIVLPYFNEFTDKSLTSHYFLSPAKLLVLIGVALITGVISGVYPALYLSSFRPIRILRGELDKGRKGVLARQILVVTQFAISIFLITGTLIASQQLNYLRNADLGFTKENIVFLPVQNSPIISQFEAYKSELLKSPDIQNVTGLNYIIGIEHNTHEFRPEGFPASEWQFYPALMVRDDFLETFEIEVIEGRGFHKNKSTDPMEAVLINEAMVEYMGWQSNENALGKRFRSQLGREKVVGIIKNFHASSLHSEVTPLVLNISENLGNMNFFTDYIAFRHTEGKQKEAIIYAKEIWDEFTPNRPFEYRILEEELRTMYREEEILGRLSMVLTILIIIIAALGLYGLASYTIDQRTKEIGIRMVLGAGILNILNLLSRELIGLIIIAILIAWPASLIIMKIWLQFFAYQIKIQFLDFAIAGIIAFLIGVIITTYKSVSSFSVRPVDTLKYE